jgi:hypothetical protein
VPAEYEAQRALINSEVAGGSQHPVGPQPKVPRDIIVMAIIWGTC